ncbi:hypothetical protein EII22_01460 [Coriobacteriales bacterium OH1046]|nr:hypothetical protein EII22_01460 [Coriobacteriales bacterium OH1046]
MARGNDILHIRLSRVFSSKVFRVGLLVSLIIMVICFVQTCLSFWGHDVGEIPSAAVAWSGNHGSMGTSLYGMYLFFLMFPISSAAASDCFYMDKARNRSVCLAQRSGTVRYVVSGAIVSFVAAFVAVLIPLFVSQMLGFLAFPVAAGQDAFAQGFNTPASYLGGWGTAYDSMMLSSVFFNDRYLYNLMFCFYDAFWAAAMALCSYAVSLYVRKGRVLVLGCPTIVFLLFSALLPSAVNPGTYVGLSVSWGVEGSLPFFVLSPLVVATGAVAAIALSLILKRDVLL